MKEKIKQMITYKRRNREANPAKKVIKETPVQANVVQERSIAEEDRGVKTPPLGNAREPINCLGMAMEEEQDLEKIEISGATLASILQRFSTSPGNVEGMLFGHVTHLTPSQFSDDDPLSSTTTSESPSTIATITSFISTSTSNLNINNNNDSSLIGWFSGRRRSALRPSLRESSVTSSLRFSSKIRIFLLLTSPPPSQDSNNDLIHTHEYKAYQFSRSKFVPKTLDVVNIGPSFRRHYGSFSPSSPFPALPCEFRGLASMAEDRNDDDGKEHDQDKERMGLDVAHLSHLMGPEASNYTAHLEDLYKGMLAKLDQLATLVDKSSARVFEQENHNMKLRFKIAGLE